MPLRPGWRILRDTPAITEGRPRPSTTSVQHQDTDGNLRERVKRRPPVWGAGTSRPPDGLRVSKTTVRCDVSVSTNAHYNAIHALVLLSEPPQIWMQATFPDIHFHFLLICSPSRLKARFSGPGLRSTHPSPQPFTPLPLFQARPAHHPTLSPKAPALGVSGHRLALAITPLSRAGFVC